MDENMARIKKLVHENGRIIVHELPNKSKPFKTRPEHEHER
jgi:hypothetical protein